MRWQDTFLLNEYEFRALLSIALIYPGNTPDALYEEAPDCSVYFLEKSSGEIMDIERRSFDLPQMASLLTVPVLHLLLPLFSTSCSSSSPLLSSASPGDRSFLRLLISSRSVLEERASPVVCSSEAYTHHASSSTRAAHRGSSSTGHPSYQARCVPRNAYLTCKQPAFKLTYTFS